MPPQDSRPYTSVCVYPGGACSRVSRVRGPEGKAGHVNVDTITGFPRARTGGGSDVGARLTWPSGFPRARTGGRSRETRTYAT